MIILPYTLSIGHTHAETLIIQPNTSERIVVQNVRQNGVRQFYKKKKSLRSWEQKGAQRFRTDSSSAAHA